MLQEFLSPDKREVFSTGDSFTVRSEFTKQSEVFIIFNSLYDFANLANNPPVTNNNWDSKFASGFLKDQLSSNARWVDSKPGDFNKITSLDILPDDKTLAEFKRISDNITNKALSKLSVGQTFEYKKVNKLYAGTQLNIPDFVRGEERCFSRKRRIIQDSPTARLCINLSCNWNVDHSRPMYRACALLSIYEILTRQNTNVEIWANTSVRSPCEDYKNPKYAHALVPVKYASDYLDLRLLQGVCSSVCFFRALCLPNRYYFLGKHSRGCGSSADATQLFKDYLQLDVIDYSIDDEASALRAIENYFL